jgi:hypothetical protein
MGNDLTAAPRLIVPLNLQPAILGELLSSRVRRCFTGRTAS